MQRKFVTNLALLLVLNLVIKGFYIVYIDVHVQNAVGTTQYGFYYAIFSFSYLFYILLDLGITNFNIKNISQNSHLLNKHFSSILVLRLLLAFVFAIVTLCVGLIVDYSYEMLQMLLIIIFNQFLIATLLYLRSNLSGLHLFKTDSVVSILDRFSLIFICLVLLYHHKMTGVFQINWFVWSQTIAYFIAVSVALIIVLRKSKRIKLAIRWPFFLMILKKSYPYAVLGLLMSFYFRIDSVLLERILPFREGAREAGIYASANRLLEGFNMIPILFAGLLLPMFARMIKLKQNVEPMVSLSFSLLVVPAIIVATTCSIFSYDIMNFLYKDHIAESSAVFKVLICCFIPYSSTYIFGTLLTANGNLKQLNIMAGTAMALSFTLNFILIPRFLASGAALSAITTQIFAALTQMIMVKKVFGFKINYKLLIKVFLFTIAIIFINLLIKNFDLYWLTKIIVACGISFVLAFALKLIRPRSIYRIVKYETD